ncbi:peptidylprolyl isomerase [Hippea sp. KM1]|uniref:peptidylprolyl isomerase n=1 Tax=Hippea sp. KM1 TaxID=944481 RepID=UPI0022B4C666|nr:peptidylprolyl isomerase [Hippea sp. KM1]
MLRFICIKQKEKAMRLRMLIIAVVILFISPLSEAQLVDKIIATVNGKPITTYELQNLAGFYRTHNIKELLNSVIDDYLIEQYAKSMGIEVQDKDIEKYMENMAHANNLSMDEFLQKLKENHIDLEYYKKGVMLKLYRIKFARRLFLGSVRVSDEDVENYYKLHKDQFKNYSKVLKLDILTMNDKKTAEAVYRQLKNNKTFESIKTENKAVREEIRQIPINALNPYLQSKLLSLKPGEYTDIIESDGRYYIVKLLKIQSGDNLKEDIRNILIDQRVSAKLKSWLKMVRARSDIEVFSK